MLLGDLFPMEELQDMLDSGFVRVQYHPKNPDLMILNYTQKTQVNHHWNEVTRQCRGLIVNSSTQEVIARPLPKFFNYGEKGADPFDLDDITLAFDKIDGSLGILYPFSDGWRIATRGSFNSEQAIKGTEFLKQYDFTPPPGVTVLFEIVYPENRIVVDYGNMSNLVYLAEVDIVTGLVTYSPSTWPGYTASVMNAGTFKSVLEMPPRDNAEGVVVHNITKGGMVKLKYDKYVELHRIVTGMNERTVWEAMQEEGKLAELREALPEEFLPWLEETWRKLALDYLAVDGVVLEEYEKVVSLPTRKEQAIAMKDLPAWIKSAVFLMLDGKSPDRVLYNQIKPEVN